jgi:hypothetical protein
MFGRRGLVLELVAETKRYGRLGCPTQNGVVMIVEKLALACIVIIGAVIEHRPALAANVILHEALSNEGKTRFAHRRPRSRMFGISSGAVS